MRRFMATVTPEMISHSTRRVDVPSCEILARKFRVGSKFRSNGPLAIGTEVDALSLHGSTCTIIASIGPFRLWPQHLDCFSVSWQEV